METSIAYLDYDKAVVSTDEQKWHRRIRELQKEYPDQVRIKYEPETNDGNMVAEIPVKWVRIRPPKRMNLTDEQRAKYAEMARNLSARNAETADSETDAEDDPDGD